MTDEQVLKELISFAAFHKQKAPFPVELQLAIDGGNALVNKLFGPKVAAAKSTYDKDLQEGLKNALKIVGEIEFKWVNEKCGEDKGDHMIESAFNGLQSLPDCGAAPVDGPDSPSISCWPWRACSTPPTTGTSTMEEDRSDRPSSRPRSTCWIAGTRAPRSGMSPRTPLLPPRSLPFW